MGLSIADSARAGGSRVLLNGLGGDQWLSGSQLIYARPLPAGAAGTLNILGDDVNAVGLRATLWHLLRHGVVPLLPQRAQQNLRGLHAKLRRSATQAEPREWLAQPMRTRFQERESGFLICRSQAQRLIAAQPGQLGCLYDAYQRMAMEIGERLYAQAGLEVRQPFLERADRPNLPRPPERSSLRGGQDNDAPPGHAGPVAGKRAAAQR
ncbi:asparagine synthase-related protein [Candidatus Skiveiella danica]|uniref:asparagine synthase-related protein n=1 Tax=Candidatus Skiveiella danica TaxID=3386177 RepID=UPI0039B91A0D